MGLFTRQPTAEEKYVFGQNCQIDPATDKPIELGIGAPGHMTANAIQARKVADEKERANAIRRTIDTQAAKAVLDDEDKF